jgi:murein L,D-transpeptidase YafK
MRRLLTLLLLIAALGLGIAAIWLRPLPPPPPLPPLSGSVDLIVVEKSARRMQLFQNGQPVRTYRIALGFAPSGDKSRQGDGRTPEGRFTIDRRNAGSAFHLSLGLDYPRPEDRARAAAGGYDPGGDIFIHGQPNSLPDGVLVKGDWTAGCIALSNLEMREIWTATPTGTPVEIRP